MRQEIESELDVTVNEICMVALLEEIEAIIEHMMIIDYNKGNIGGPIRGYVIRATQHLMTDSLPLPVACLCRPHEEFECRWHIPHLQYLLGYAAAMIAVDVNNNEWADGLGGGVEISSERLMNTFLRILHHRHDPYHQSLKEALYGTACSLVLQYKES